MAPGGHRTHEEASQAQGAPAAGVVRAVREVNYAGCSFVVNRFPYKTRVNSRRSSRVGPTHRRAFGRAIGGVWRLVEYIPTSSDPTNDSEFGYLLLQKGISRDLRGVENGNSSLSVEQLRGVW
jgi:hypothetical protein